MERGKKRTEDINPLLLLLKVAIPLAFPLAGFILSTLAITSGTKRTTQSTCPPKEEQMDSPISISHHEQGDDGRSYGLNSSSMYQENEEQEPEMRQPLMSLHNSSSLEIAKVQCFNDTREISFEQSKDGPDLEEEIETLKSQVTALQDREHEFDSQLDHYCNLKEQESAIQKLQIMCLGFKLESLEAQNQRLEDTIGELREAIKQYDVIKDALRLLQRKVKKLNKKNKLHSRLIHQQALNLDAREVELLRTREELKQANKEIRALADQLHQDNNKAMEEKLEQKAMMNPSASKNDAELMMDDDGMPRVSNKELLDQVERFRERWYADMEEMIYIGWIGACLRHEIWMNQMEEDEKPVREVGDHLVVELPVDDRAKNCVMEFHGSDCSSSVADLGDAGMDVAAMKHRSGSTKPRLLHKIKGWAKGKKRSKRWCD